MQECESKKKEKKAKQADKENYEARPNTFNFSITIQFKAVSHEKGIGSTPKIPDDICVVCSGAHCDDVDESGNISADWIQCAVVFGVMLNA